MSVVIEMENIVEACEEPRFERYGEEQARQPRLQKKKYVARCGKLASSNSVVESLLQ